MQTPFDGTEKTLSSPLISNEELRSVLEVIHEEQFAGAALEASPYDDWATVEAICEATGHRPDEVQRVLEKLRREDLASRISTQLRELEEPTFRVERPGHHKPSASAPMIRFEQINTILDRIAPANKSTRHKIALSTSKSEQVVSSIGAVIALLIVLGILVVIIQAIVTN